MNSRDKVKKYLSTSVSIWHQNDEDLLVALLDEHAAEVIRETLAAWMIHNGYATGHGDTIEDLMEELGEELRGKQ